MMAAMSWKSWLVLSIAALGMFTAGCGSPPEEPAPMGPCDPERQACHFAHDFGAAEVKAGEEISDLCFSWTVGNTTELLVNSTELNNDGAYHHSNWFFVPETSFVHPDGQFPCSTIHFDEVTAALLGGVLFAQSTQAEKEVQRFAPGAVVRVPANARILGSVHLLNASPTDRKTGLRLTMHTLPPDQVKVPLTPFRLTYYNLRLPPMRRSEVGGACDLRAPYEKRIGEPFRMHLYFVLPHYHQLGRRFLLQLLGGPRDGQTLFDSRAEVGEPGGMTFDPAVDLSQADGFKFSCTFDNPRSSEVRWGIGDQEMCEMLGFADSRAAFDAVVKDGQQLGGSDPSGTTQFSGPCDVAAYRVR